MVVSKLSMLIENKIINALQCNASNKWPDAYFIVSNLGAYLRGPLVSLLMILQIIIYNYEIRELWYIALFTNNFYSTKNNIN